MSKPRDQNSTPRAAHAAPGPGLAAVLRSACGDGCVAFAVNLWLDAAVFTVAASAIVFAVWRQDPGERVAAAPPAARVSVPAWNAPARNAGLPPAPPLSWQLARRTYRPVPADGG